MISSLIFLLISFSFGCVVATTYSLDPSQNVASVINGAAAGSVFNFAAGTYRLTTAIIPKTGQAFYGSTTGETILSGATLLTTYTHTAPHYIFSVTGGNSVFYGQCQEGFAMCGYCNDIFYNNVPLLQVNNTALVNKAGTFYFDYSAKQIYTFDDPSGKTVEVSIQAAALTSGGASNVIFKNMVVEKFANEGGLNGAVITHTGWQVLDSIFRWNHATGLQIWNSTAIGNLFYQNGQTGIKTFGWNNYIHNNEASYNNYANFDMQWEAGGSKFWQTTNQITTNNWFHHNNGKGIWADTDNMNISYINNLVEYNNNYGFNHEISMDCVITGNVIRYNLLANFYLDGSRNAKIHNNIFQRGTEGGKGWMYVWYARGDSDRYGYLRATQNNYFYNNTIIMDSVAVSGHWGDSSGVTISKVNPTYGNTYHFSTLAAGTKWFTNVLTSGSTANFDISDWQTTYSMDLNSTFDTNTAYVDAPPSLSVTSPSGSSYSPTSSLVFSATASDPIGINRVDFYANGNLLISDVDAPYTYTIPANTFTGALMLQAIAYDIGRTSATWSNTLNPGSSSPTSTTQAGSSTTQAGSSTTQAGSSTTHAGSSTTSKSSSTTMTTGSSSNTLPQFYWTSNGSKKGSCVQITEPQEPASHTWYDNYLCCTSESISTWKWSSSGVISGMNCIQWLEAADSNGWNNNYLCIPTTDKRVYKFNSAGKISGMTCTQTLETADPNTWADNYWCVALSGSYEVDNSTVSDGASVDYEVSQMNYSATTQANLLLLVVLVVINLNFLF